MPLTSGPTNSRCLHSTPIWKPAKATSPRYSCHLNSSSQLVRVHGCPQLGVQCAAAQRQITVRPVRPWLPSPDTNANGHYIKFTKLCGSGDDSSYHEHEMMRRSSDAHGKVATSMGQYPNIVTRYMSREHRTCNSIAMQRGKHCCDGAQFRLRPMAD
jgi:hypothetical protein